MTDTRLRLNLLSAPCPVSWLLPEFVPAELAKTKGARRSQNRRFVKFSFRGIRRQNGSGKFVAIGENQFFHLHAFFAVLGGRADHGDLIPGFERASAPASSR